MGVTGEYQWTPRCLSQPRGQVSPPLIEIKCHFVTVVKLSAVLPPQGSPLFSDAGQEENAQLLVQTEAVPPLLAQG